MEAVKLPLRELRKRYTKSEMFVMAWRSSEIAYNMGKLHKTEAPTPEKVATASQSAYEARLESQLGSIVDKLTDEEGEVSLHGLTGKEAMHFMGSMGIGGRS
jgi:hypothetical protein